MQQLLFQAKEVGRGFYTTYLNVISNNIHIVQKAEIYPFNLPFSIVIKALYRVLVSTSIQILYMICQSPWTPIEYI